MKSIPALLTCLLACLAAFPLPAQPAEESTVFEGVNLSGLTQTRQLGDLPELYEPDPADGRRFRLRRDTVQIPLGEAWITFSAEHNVSWLNKVPGRNPANYFGPIPGDAFEHFRLEEKFIAQLRKDSASDVEYRLDLMLRTGHPRLRERAIRIMTAGLAPDISAETRAYHVGRFKSLATGLEGGDADRLRQAIAQTEARIHELTLALPDSDYSPGNDALEREGKLGDGMKPDRPVPAAAWGEPKDGLRAAAVFSPTGAALGQEITVWLLVENVGDREIRFGSSDVMQTAQPRIVRPDGTEVQARSSWYSGLSPIRRHKLQPGERLTLARKTLSFEPRNSQREAGFGMSRVATGPGEYRVRYESVLATGSAWTREADGLMHRTYPARGEWSGHLATAETWLVISGQDPAAAVPAEANPGKVLAAAPARSSKARPTSIQLTVLDAEGRPVPEFHVVAGVKSSVSPRRDPEIVNWQPHTLRTGQGGTLDWPMAKAYDPMALRVEADGFAPQTFAWLNRKEPHDLEFRLQPDPGLAGLVLGPDGQPAANATVALAMVQRDAVIEEGRLRHAGQTPPARLADRWRWPRMATTDAGGRFQLPAENDPTAALLVVHEKGVRELSLADFQRGADGLGQPGSPMRQVKLQAWGRVEGRAQWGDIPGAGRKVSLSIHRDTYGYPGVIAQYESVTTDASGRFTFERVLPGLTQFSCPLKVDGGEASGISEINLPGLTTHLTVAPGRNTALLGGQGRTLRGRLIGRDSFADITLRFHPTAPRVGFGGDPGIWSAWTALRESPLGPAFHRGGLKLAADGTFEIPAVFPGSYQLFIQRAGQPEHLAAGSFHVPPETPGQPRAPLDIGEFRCRTAPAPIETR